MDSLIEQPIGLYPVVDSFAWIQRLAKAGITTIQLRIKNANSAFVENEIRQSVDFCQANKIRLFINDYWELAIQFKAYGVHLGQEDLKSCELNVIKAAGVRLGISTHGHPEMLAALQVNPSYVACGPVFPTTSKPMPYVPQGLAQLRHWVSSLNVPLVAIGGINADNIREVIATGVDGVAMISALTRAANPEVTARQFVELINR